MTFVLDDEAIVNIPINEIEFRGIADFAIVCDIDSTIHVKTLKTRTQKPLKEKIEIEIIVGDVGL